MPSSVYAKYFFDLRTLAEANELAYPAEPLSKVCGRGVFINKPKQILFYQERALKLEAMSRTYEDKLAQDLLGTAVKRSNSLDRYE